jgi:hypothetical protein
MDTSELNRDTRLRFVLEQGCPVGPQRIDGQRLNDPTPRRRPLEAPMRRTPRRRRAAPPEYYQATSIRPAEVRRSLTGCRALLTGDVAQARLGLRQLLTSPIQPAPFNERGRRGLRLEGRVGLDAILGGEVVTKLASPTGRSLLWKPEIKGKAAVAA